MRTIEHCPICGHRLDAPGAACTNCEGTVELDTAAISGAELSQADHDYGRRIRQSGRRVRPQRGGR